MVDYKSTHTGLQVDEAVDRVLTNNCIVKFQNIIGEVSDNTQLQAALDALKNTHLTLDLSGEDYSIKKDAIVQTFADVLGYIMDTKTFTYLTYNNNIYLPLKASTTQIIFTSPFDSNAYVISSNNKVTLSTDNLVHKTGDETIEGYKTFSNNVSVGGSLTVNGDATLNGTSRAQTPPQGTADTQIATTEFVSNFSFKGYTPPLLSMQQSTIKLNDIQWLRSDTFSWQDGTLYEAAYNKLVEEYNSNNKTAFLNVDTIGTPNITDQGIASGFSTSSYLRKAITLSSDRTAVFPIVFNITTRSYATTEQYIFAIDNWCTMLSMSPFGKLKLYLGSGSAWDIADAVSGNTVLKANNNYKVEIDYDGTTYTVKLTDLTSTTSTVTTDIEVTSSTMVSTGLKQLTLGTNASHTNHFLGSIDVANCQVGEAWKGAFGYRTQNDFFIVGPEQELYCLQKYNSDGIAWYFILDTVNTRFKLPRTKWGFKGLRDQAGNEINESLPSHTHTRGTMNITGYFEFDSINSQQAYGGAFNGVQSTTPYGGATNTQNNRLDFTFDASRSWTGNTSNPLGSDVYQDGANVQEKGTQVYTYFYVGEWTKDATENTAGLNSELFNNKVDINGSNLNAQGRSYFSGFGMPSMKFETQTVGASGATYIAPSNGWYCGSCVEGDVKLENNSVNTYGAHSAKTAWNGGKVYIPCQKGNEVTFAYNGTTTTLTFYYAEGETTSGGTTSGGTTSGGSVPDKT